MPHRFTLARFVAHAITSAVLMAYGGHSLCASQALVLSADGLTVYDSTNGVTWLANANLPATNRFTLPLCTPAGIEPCVNASGAMSYQSATAWIKALNAANYLGHTNWQIPNAPIFDPGCSFTGPQNNSFGWNCSASALGSLFYTALALKAPDSAVVVPNIKTGPFTNFQPSVYWSQTSLPQPTGDVGCCATFSFNSGWQGSNIASNLLFLLPMIQGSITGAPAVGTALQVNSGGQTVYDPIANVTWLTNANLAATNTFGLPACKAPGNPNLCVDPSGAMNFNSADQFIKNMNAAAYLGQSKWQLPPADANCAASYLCSVANAPFQSLFYTQLGLTPGTPVVVLPDLTVGPFTGIRPYLYWACESGKIQDPCQSAGPAPGFQWSFWFDNGFQGTDVLAHDMYVTAYFPGTRTSNSGPLISEVASAASESPVIAPNTWVEIKGVGLAPPGDSRVWQAADFAGNTMPTQLDRVSATVNGKNAYVYYVSPAQVNILTPPDTLSGTVQLVLTNNGTSTAAFTAQAQSISPSFFMFGGGPYVAAEHLNGSLIGPATLYPGLSTPAQPGETIVLYANGFGPTSVPVIGGSIIQTGTLSPLPVIQIGSVKATVQFAGLVAPGEFQLNVVVPATASNGDLSITATYGGATTQSGALLTIHK